jgi:FkbM family methyltransferase
MLKTKQKIALARLVQIIVMGARKLMGLGAMTQVKRNGVMWELDLKEGIDFSIWLLGSFEPETVRCYQRIVKSGDVVLDIGANIGAHTLFLAKSAGAGGRVIAFEPTDYAFLKLSQNIRLNKELAGRIQCLQCMLVDSETEDCSTPALYSSWPLKVDGIRHDLHQGRLMATSGAKPRTLDSTILSIGLDRVDCIKLDIDGFECGMLRGAREMLTRWQPTIIMELAPYALEEQGASLNELIHLLKEHGYALYGLSTGEPLNMADIAKLQHMIPSGASLNVVARVTSGANGLGE